MGKLLNLIAAVITSVAGLPDTPPPNQNTPHVGTADAMQQFAKDQKSRSDAKDAANKASGQNKAQNAKDMQALARAHSRDTKTVLTQARKNGKK